MAIDRNLKIGIIGGLISAIVFWVFIGPILSFSSKVIMNIGSKVYSSFVDGQYERASLGEPESSAYWLQFFILIMMSGFFTGTYVVILRARLKKRPKKRQGIKFPLSFLARRWLITYTLLLILIYFGAIMTLWSSWFNIKVTTSFKHHMRIVAPYLAEEEEELVWSEWAQMKNRADYNKIYEKLIIVANRNHIELPENPVYTFKKL